MGYLHVCLIQEVWQATAGYQPPPCNEQCECWEFPNALGFLPYTAGGGNMSRYLIRESTRSPVLMLTTKRWVEVGTFSLSPPPHLLYLWKKWLVSLVTFGLLGSPLLGLLEKPAWPCISCILVCLHDVITLAGRFLQGESSTSRECGLWEIALALDLKWSCKSVIKLTFSYKADILIFICLSLCLHSYIVWT